MSEHRGGGDEGVFPRHGRDFRFYLVYGGKPLRILSESPLSPQFEGITHSISLRSQVLSKDCQH